MDRTVAAIYVLAVTFISVNGGLYVDEIQNEITGLLKTTHQDKFEDNIIKVLSWNILKDLDEEAGKDEFNYWSKQEKKDYPDSFCQRKDKRWNWQCRKRDICNYINKIQPTVFGLQEVMQHQLKDLILCMPGYNYVGAARSPRQSNTLEYNPIFYKKSRKLRKVISGTFWLSTTPHIPGTRIRESKYPRICTWVKFFFAKRYESISRYKREIYRNKTSTRTALNSKIRNLLLQFANKKKVYNTRPHRRRITPAPKRSSPKRKPPKKRIIGKWKWKIIYVANTHLESENASVANDQMKILSAHFKQSITGRNWQKRPVILMGTFADKRTFLWYQRNQTREKKWLRDATRTAVSKYRNMTATKPYRIEDYIFQNKLESLVAGPLYNNRPNGLKYSTHFPIFAALT